MVPDGGGIIMAGEMETAGVMAAVLEMAMETVAVQAGVKVGCGLAKGSKDIGGFMLGSVSQKVLAHAKCPVLVVRGKGDKEESCPGC